MRARVAMSMVLISAVTSAFAVGAQTFHPGERGPLLAQLLAVRGEPLVRTETQVDLNAAHEDVPLAVLPNDWWVVMVSVDLLNVTQDAVKVDGDDFVLRLDDGRRLAFHRGWMDFYSGCPAGSLCDEGPINPGFTSLLAFAVPLPIAPVAASFESTDGSISLDLGPIDTE